MPRSGEHYMPRPDGDFGSWANHYVEAVENWWGVQGLPPNGLDPLKEALTAWNAAYPAHIQAQAAAASARRSKDDARRTLEARARPITNFVQTFFTTTDADRATMGITVRPPHGTPARTPTTRPLALVEGGQRLMHQLRLVDEAAPTRRAKPAGVLGAEVWVKLVAPPSADSPAPTDPARDPNSFTFLTMTTRTTCRAEFPQAAGGKNAVYMARWVSTRGEKGPWSEVTTATVAA